MVLPCTVQLSSNSQREVIEVPWIVMFHSYIILHLENSFQKLVLSFYLKEILFCHKIIWDEDSVRENSNWPVVYGVQTLQLLWFIIFWKHERTLRKGNIRGPISLNIGILNILKSCLLIAIFENYTNYFSYISFRYNRILVLESVWDFSFVIHNSLRNLA